MGLFDRFRRKPAAQTPTGEGNDKSFYLDADKSSSLGDVEFMRRSNLIRHTYPGTVDNPGLKERIDEVASMQSRVELVSEGLPNADASEANPYDPTAGVPKQVKKTFAQQISQQELENRLRGSAVAGTNGPGASSKSEAKQENSQESFGSKPSSPGSTDPFRNLL
jgi:hypothetical protein